MSKFPELIATIAESHSLTKAEAHRVVETIFGFLQTQMTAGAEVRIPGFGGFSTNQRQAGRGRNPRTGEEIDIPARTLASFRAAAALRAALQPAPAPAPAPTAAKGKTPKLKGAPMKKPAVANGAASVR